MSTAHQEDKVLRAETTDKATMVAPDQTMVTENMDLIETETVVATATVIIAEA
jgi:hypothetical protein